MFIIVIVILSKNRAIQCFNVYEPLSHLRDGGMYLGRLKYTVKKKLLGTLLSLISDSLKCDVSKHFFSYFEPSKQENDVRKN
jgi:hypothetical protein